jgi:FtsH-binding integral membrane protein
MSQDKDVRVRDVNPVTRSAFRRQVWLEIYLPLTLGLAAVVGMAWALARSGAATPRAWADASTVLLILPILAAALVPMVIFIALSVGIIILIRRLPEVSQKLQSVVYRVQWSTRRGADTAVQPWLMGESARAAGRAAIDVLFSIFRPRKGSRP